MTIATKAGFMVRFDGSTYAASINGQLVKFQLLTELEDWLSRLPLHMDDWWYLNC